VPDLPRFGDAAPEEPPYRSKLIVLRGNSGSGKSTVRGWYRARNVTGFANETIIPESSSVEESVRLIVRTAELHHQPSSSGGTDGRGQSDDRRLNVARWP
jgi:hypothetical protein